MVQQRLLSDVLTLYRRHQQQSTELQRLQQLVKELEENAASDTWSEVYSPDVGVPAPPP